MTARAPLDDLRALPTPLHRLILARMAAEHGPEAVAALRYAVDAHRRPSQALPVAVADLPPVLVITGEYGTGKTQLSTWIFLRALLDWRVERPRIVAATREKVRDTLVTGPSGLLSWLPPWIPREWQPSNGHAGLLRIDGTEVSCISADAGANSIGSGAGFVLFDDFAQCVEALGASRAEDALVAAFKSLREWPGKMLLPTTPDGAEMVQDLASAGNMRGVQVLDLGKVEENAGNLATAYKDHVANLRALDRFVKKGGGAFDHIPWRELRIAASAVPRLVRAIVFVDPAKSQRSHACKVGIVGLAIDARGTVYGLVNKSAQRGPDGPDGWPAAAIDAAEEIERTYGFRPDEVELGIECNTLGKSGPEHLRAEQRIRNAGQRRPAVAPRTIHEVTSRPNDPKTRRAAPVVAMAEGKQLWMVVGLGEVESSLSRLTDAGTKADEADCVVHGTRILAGLGDGKEAKDERERILAAEGTRRAFQGFEAAQNHLPRVAFDLERA